MLNSDAQYAWCIGSAIANAFRLGYHTQCFSYGFDCMLACTTLIYGVCLGYLSALQAGASAYCGAQCLQRETIALQDSCLTRLLVSGLVERVVRARRGGLPARKSPPPGEPWALLFGGEISRDRLAT